MAITPSTDSQRDERTPTRSNEWDLPVGPDARRRAAILLWVVGGLEVVLSGSCAAACLAMMAIDPARLGEMSGQPVPPDIQRLLAVYAIGMLVLGCVPGAAYVIVGFPVRAGKPAAIRFALVLAAAQALVLVVIAVDSVISAAASGNPAAFTMAVILFGTPLLLLGFTVRWLLAAQQG